MDDHTVTVHKLFWKSSVSGVRSGSTTCRCSSNTVLGFSKEITPDQILSNSGKDFFILGLNSVSETYV